MARRGGNRQLQGFTHEDHLALFAAQTCTTEDGCVEWAGALYPSGYGTVTRNGVSFRAHRVAWTDAHGSIPEGLIVRHLCHNPKCVNIAHLALGTHQDNANDRVAADRGARLGRRRFLDVDIVAAIGLVALGWSQKQAASLFGMDQSHLSRLVRGESGRVGGVRP